MATASPRILLVEDEPTSQEIFRESIRGIADVRIAATLAEAQNALRSEVYDLLVLDLLLPDGESYELCRSIRIDPRSRRTPVIFLTGKNGIDERLTGFEMGADDFITKPVHPLELVARVKARLRDTPWDPSWSNELGLTHTESMILWFLSTQRDQVVSRTAILMELRRDDSCVSDRTVDVHVSRLRRKIQPTGMRIQSVYGIGYVFSIGEPAR